MTKKESPNFYCSIRKGDNDPLRELLFDGYSETQQEHEESIKKAKQRFASQSKVFLLQTEITIKSEGIVEVYQQKLRLKTSKVDYERGLTKTIPVLGVQEARGLLRLMKKDDLVLK
tara:strand:+ start:575 stop:922 length:348 start_codon:yes stop_codon:yes gene_type:complete